MWLQREENKIQKNEGLGMPSENVSSQMPRQGSVPESKEQSTLVKTSKGLYKRIQNCPWG